MPDTIMPTYARLPVSFSPGEGAWLWDEQGNKYLDAISGIAVCNLGHAHPAVADAICQQARTLVHTSNLYGIEHQGRLADKLTALSGMEKGFFGNSGAEANEAAIKLARLYGHNQGIDNPTIIVAENSFHGRTLATLSATGNPKVQAGFEPLVGGFLRVPYNNLAAIQAASENCNVVAVLLEPVQGEGGVNLLDDGFLAQLRALCDRNQWLLMLDEIQTGMCRTGQWFAFQQSPVTPDVVTLAKALGNGMPIGACLAKGKAAAIFGPGNHGSTFGGNPLVCRAALAVIEAMEKMQAPERAANLASAMVRAFTERLGDLPQVKAIRHQGLMIGIQLDQPCGELVKTALAHRLLINVTANNVIRLLPPLILNSEERDLIVDGVCRLVTDFGCNETQQG